MAAILKRFYRYISDGNHPISMKFGVQMQILAPRTVIWQSITIFGKFKMAEGRNIENRFGYNSTIYCLIIAKFVMKNQNYTQTQVTWLKYQTEFLYASDCMSTYRSDECSELISDVFLWWLFYKDKSAICTH